MSQATQRATMPKGTHAVMENRTVFNANKNLLALVKPGSQVLDVGCGAGSITASLISVVGETGSVTGIDTSEHLISLAKATYSSLHNLHFEVADILQYAPATTFDVVSAARVLQWVANPQELLHTMITLLKPGGYISVLDYNHEKIQWLPAIPRSTEVFYAAFLRWRKDAGMNNEIADQLAGMFKEAGLKNITESDHSELVSKTDAGFAQQINIWAVVAATRGKQMVSDGYLSEEERAVAEKEYMHWTTATTQSMKMYLLAVSGQKKE